MRFVIALAVSAVVHAPIVTAGPEPEPAPAENYEDVTPCGPRLPIDPVEEIEEAPHSPRLEREMAIELASTRFLPAPRRAYEEDRPRRALEVGYVTASGELDRNTVRRSLRFRAQELARCNHMQLDEVTVAIDLLVADDGRAKATVRGDEPAVTACVERELRAIEFRRSYGETQAHFALTLRPRYGTISYEPAGFVR